jgi:hypothetical protein
LWARVVSRVLLQIDGRLPLPCLTARPHDTRIEPGTARPGRSAAYRRVMLLMLRSDCYEMMIRRRVA